MDVMGRALDRRRIVFCALACIIGCQSTLPAATSQVQEVGLAARYPGDRGLSQDPAVVFSDDIESAPAGAIPKGFRQEHGVAWNSPWDHTWGVPTPQIIAEPSRVHAGRQALELTKNGPGATGLSKYFDPGFDRLYLRYYLKYDDAFPGAHHVGGTIDARAPGVPAANPGVVPDGTNKFTVSLDHWRNEPRMAPPGPLVAYVYHMDQRHKWGEQFYPSGKTRPPANGQRGLFGPSFVPRQDFVPVRGRWYCYELMVQVNTPGLRDGRVAFWVDGRLTGDFPNLRFRSVESLRINRVSVTLYESRNKTRDHDDPRRVWIDDVVMATTYVGPMASERQGRD